MNKLEFIQQASIQLFASGEISQAVLIAAGLVPEKGLEFRVIETAERLWEELNKKGYVDSEVPCHQNSLTVFPEDSFPNIDPEIKDAIVAVFD